MLSKILKYKIKINKSIKIVLKLKKYIKLIKFLFIIILNPVDFLTNALLYINENSIDNEDWWTWLNKHKWLIIGSAVAVGIIIIIITRNIGNNGGAENNNITYTESKSIVEENIEDSIEEEYSGEYRILSESEYFNEADELELKSIQEAREIAELRREAIRLKNEQELKIAEILIKKYNETETIFREIPVETETETNINTVVDQKECILEDLTPEELNNIEILIERNKKT